LFDNSLGLCLGRHGDLDFFGVLTDEILNLCNACPIREECEEHGIQNEEYGIWGGKSEEELANARKNRKIIVNKRRNEPMDRKRKENPVILHGKIEGYRAETYYGMEHCAACKKTNAERSAELREAARERAMAA